MADITIEIAYGTAAKQKLYHLTLPQGSTARQAVCAAAPTIAADFPEAHTQTAPLGIFGKAVKDDHLLQNGDRIEIYRPLLADPKEARRKRAAAKR